MLAITPGDASADQLRAAGLATDVLAWRDLLHEGPVPAGLLAAELAQVRADYLAGTGWPGTDGVAAQLVARDAALAEAAARPIEIALWFDHNLVNRLALLQVLDRLAELRGPGLPGVTLAEPHGFGDTPAAALQALAAQRRPVTADLLTHARAAWTAFRSADPTALIRYLADGPVAGLGAALGRHLAQFPHLGDGLAETERRAMAAVADGAADFPAVFGAVTAEDDPPWLADTVLQAHLARLASTRHPLLDGYRLTDHGHAVLAGQADHLALNGIDRWLGGAHLTDPMTWRYDPTRRTVVKP